MTQFDFLQQKNNFHKKRAENSEKMRLLSLAGDAIQDNPELTRSEFMQFDKVKRLNLCEKTIRTYLVGFPFSPEPEKKKNKQDKVILDVWYKGYIASEQGKSFHQALVTRGTAKEAKDG